SCPDLDGGGSSCRGWRAASPRVSALRSLHPDQLLDVECRRRQRPLRSSPLQPPQQESPHIHLMLQYPQRRLHRTSPQAVVRATLSVFHSRPLPLVDGLVLCPMNRAPGLRRRAHRPERTSLTRFALVGITLLHPRPAPAALRPRKRQRLARWAHIA